MVFMVHILYIYGVYGVYTIHIVTATNISPVILFPCPFCYSDIMMMIIVKDDRYVMDSIGLIIV